MADGTGDGAQPRVLAVEGTHEEDVLDALLREPDMAALAPINVRGIAGKTRLRASLRDLAKDPDLLRLYDGGASIAIGVVRDADGDAASALQSVRSALESAGFPAPHSSGQFVVGDLTGPHGPVIEAVTVGIFIMPGGGRPGALEDLLIEAVQAEGAYECVDGLYTCLESAELPLPPPHRMGKARAAAYVATKPNPAMHVGSAAKEGYWHSTTRPSIPSSNSCVPLRAGDLAAAYFPPSLVFTTSPPRSAESLAARVMSRVFRPSM